MFRLETAVWGRFCCYPCKANEATVNGTPPQSARFLHVIIADTSQQVMISFRSKNVRPTIVAVEEDEIEP